VIWERVVDQVDVSVATSAVSFGDGGGLRREIVVMLDIEECAFKSSRMCLP
jgi:hypothetical protein